MRKLILSLAISSAFLVTFSQSTDSLKFDYKNSIQLEAGGHSVFYAVNYERIVLKKAKYKGYIQLGISYYPPVTGIRDIWIPVSLNGLKSFGAHHIEIGTGYMLTIEAIRDEDNKAREWFTSGLLCGRIGYRYQKPSSHFLLRIGFTPVFELDGLEFHPLPGLAVGYSF